MIQTDWRQVFKDYARFMRTYYVAANEFHYIQDRMDDQLQNEFAILECKDDMHLTAYGYCLDRA